MTDIKVSDLLPAGSELFSDFEGYFRELSEAEVTKVQGGIFGCGYPAHVSPYIKPTPLPTPPSKVACSSTGGSPEAPACDVDYC